MKMPRTQIYIGRFWAGGWPVIVEEDSPGRWLVIELTENNPRREGDVIITDITRMFRSKEEAVEYANHICFCVATKWEPDDTTRGDGGDSFGDGLADGGTDSAGYRQFH